MIARFVTLITYFFNSSRNKCQYAYFYTKVSIFQSTVKLGGQSVGLHEKRLFITFRKKQDRKCMIAHFVALITYFLNTGRNKCQYAYFYTKISINCRVR